MLKFGRIEIAPGFWVLLVTALAVGAGEVMPLAALAALVHELGHIAALRAFGVEIASISLGGFGAEIRADTRYLSYGRDILCTLAGPLTNILLGFLLARVSGDYLFAGANLLLGVFNLLPMSGLDGARALHLFLSLAADLSIADRVCFVTEFLFASLFLVLTVYVVVLHRTGIFLLGASAGVLRGTIKGWRGK